jgi:hypothetical protein
MNLPNPLALPLLLNQRCPQSPADKTMEDSEKWMGRRAKAAAK